MLVDAGEGPSPCCRASLVPKPVVVLLQLSTVPLQLCSVLQEARAALDCLQLCRELISVEMYLVSCAVMYLLASKFEK